MSETRVTDKKTLMEHIERDWAALNRLLDSLSESQWGEIRNTDGWAIKDHVAHLTTWERSVSALLTGGRSQHEGLGITEDVCLRGDIDAINAAIFDVHQHEPLNVVRTQFQATHEQLCQLIEPLTNEDLNLPFTHYLPDGPGDGDGPPVITLVYGNTADHFRTHQAWIEEMLAAASTDKRSRTSSS